MKVYSVTETIDATPEIIWDLLTEAGKYPDWNPTVKKIEGQIAPGKKIKVFTSAMPDRGFDAKVTEFDPCEYMVWVGGMPLGLFTGVRTFKLTHLVDDSTKFEMEEVFSGLISPLILRSMPDLTGAFIAYGKALRKHAESITKARSKQAYDEEKSHDY